MSKLTDIRLIDADALCEGLAKDFGYRFPLYDGTRLGATQLLVTREDVMTFIRHFAPTIEAEPVRHGRWEWYEDWGPSTWLEPPDIINEGWKCTECGIDLGEYLTAKLHEEVYVGDMDKKPDVNRCPNCGAKMDAKEGPHEDPGP